MKRYLRLMSTLMAAVLLFSFGWTAAATEKEAVAVHIPSRVTKLDLPEDVSEYDPMMITGKLENGTTVHVAAEPEDQQRLIGTVRQVRLEESHGFYYTGSLV